MDTTCNTVKGGNNSSLGSYTVIRDCVFPWTISRWGQTTLAEGRPLINLPGLTTESIDLMYTEEEVETRKPGSGQRERVRRTMVQLCPSWVDISLFPRGPTREGGIYDWCVFAFPRGMRQNNFQEFTNFPVAAGYPCPHA